MDRRVGYLILDQEIVDDTQLSYFSSNNIEVININSMPLIQEIPADLSNEIGKRLYSFLRVIANPALEENLSTIENAVKFMSRFSFVSYEQILKLLYVKRYEVTDRELRLFSENDYARLIAFMESGDEGATDLRQLFLNAGIVSIQCIHEHTLTAKQETVNPKLTALNMELARVEDEIEKLLNTLTGANAVLLSYANSKIEELDTRRQALTKEIAALSAETMSPEQIERLSVYLNQWEEIDFEDRRQVADGLISQIRATDEHVSIEWKI